MGSTKVGDQVQGSLPQGAGSLAWTGKITQHVVISPKQGCVTVRVVSDKYIAPGTKVNGMVGGNNFQGTVTQAPNKFARIGNIERRLGALEPANRGRMERMKAKLEKMDRKLMRLEGHKTIQEKVDDLEKEIVALEKRPPTPHGMLFAGNVAGFHFTGSLGKTDGFRRRVDRLDARLSNLEARESPGEVAKPLQKMASRIERRLDELQGDGGRLTQRKELAGLEKRLREVEKVYSSGGGDNSKWYGTEEYHGIYHNPTPAREDDQASGLY
uniref:Uncharacterized protein n=1 Tax=Hemiselmis tepida TaxID=464990 RepID=A0A7S0YFT1_9CRYP